MKNRQTGSILAKIMFATLITNPLITTNNFNTKYCLCIGIQMSLLKSEVMLTPDLDLNNYVHQTNQIQQRTNLCD